MFKLELSLFVPYLCYFQLVYLQGQTIILGIINILLNNRTQIKNVQPLSTKSPRLHCWQSKVSSITFALTKTSPIENQKWQEVTIHMIFLIF